MTENKKAVGFLLTSKHPESTEAMVVLREAGADFSFMDNEFENALPVFYPLDENRQYVGLDSIKTFVENFTKKRGGKSE